MTEDEYVELTVVSNRLANILHSPGRDESVVSDAQILSAVQAEAA